MSRSQSDRTLSTSPQDPTEQEPLSEEDREFCDRFNLPYEERPNKDSGQF